jgi:hypothetical protein
MAWLDVFYHRFEPAAAFDLVEHGSDISIWFFDTVAADDGSVHLSALPVVQRHSIWCIDVIAKRIIDLDLERDK